MAQIPTDQKFQTLASEVPTINKRSAQINARGTTYTMQDIIDTVGGGGGTTGFNFEVVVRETAVSAAGDAEGNVVKLNTQATTPGSVYVYNGFYWYPADSDVETRTAGLLGMALGTNSNTDGMLVNGIGRFAVNFTGTTSTGLLYLSGSAGVLTYDKPVTGFVRAVGYATGANTAYFSPSQDYITLA
jgi:hypothetical protein